MTDPRIALADRLRKHVSDRGGQFKDDDGNIVIPNGAWQMMIDAADEIERLQTALRAIQPETGVREALEAAKVLIDDLSMGFRLPEVDRVKTLIDAALSVKDSK